MERHGLQHLSVVILTILGLLHFFRLSLLVFLLSISLFRQHQPTSGVLHKRETFAKNQYMGRDDTHELYTPLTTMRDIILILFFLFL
jgi:hypothetical protein